MYDMVLHNKTVKKKILIEKSHRFYNEENWKDKMVHSQP